MPRERYEDDELGRDHDQYDRRSSSTKTTIVVLAIVFGLIISGVIGCFGFVVYRVMKIKENTDFSNETMSAGTTFIDHLKMNRSEFAYKSTSKAYQARVSREQFEQLVKSHPIIMNHDRWFNTMVSFPTDIKKPEAEIEYFFDKNVIIFQKPIVKKNDDENSEIDPTSNPIIEEAEPTEKAITVKVKIIKENGRWTVDDFVILKKQQ